MGSWLLSWGSQVATCRKEEEKENREDWRSLLKGVDQGHVAKRSVPRGQVDGEKNSLGEIQTARNWGAPLGNSRSSVK